MHRAQLPHAASDPKQGEQLHAREARERKAARGGPLHARVSHVKALALRGRTHGDAALRPDTGPSPASPQFAARSGNLGCRASFCYVHVVGSIPRAVRPEEFTSSDLPECGLYYSRSIAQWASSIRGVAAYQPPLFSYL